MADTDAEKDQDIPKPDPALKRLDRLVGSWQLTGRTRGSDAADITGTATYQWLHKVDDAETGFFLQQDMEMDYAGQPIRSRELIGYEPRTKAFSSHVYSNMAPDPWPYAWDIQGDLWTISIRHGPMDATFTGRFAADGNSFSGSWRPSPGADETVNAPYDISGTRVG